MHHHFYVLLSIVKKHSIRKQIRNLLGRKAIEGTQVTLLSSFSLKAHEMSMLPSENYEVQSFLYHLLSYPLAFPAKNYFVFAEPRCTVCNTRYNPNNLSTLQTSCNLNDLLSQDEQIHRRLTDTCMF